LLVVVDQELPSRFAHVLKPGEEVLIQHFLPVCPIEPLDVGVLIRLARFLSGRVGTVAALGDRDAYLPSASERETSELPIAADLLAGRSSSRRIRVSGGAFIPIRTFPSCTESTSRLMSLPMRTASPPRRVKISMAHPWLVTCTEFTVHHRLVKPPAKAGAVDASA
jgi:hypothetical protein